MSGVKTTFLFLIFVGFAFCQENQEPRRTCRQSLMAGLRAIFEEDANDNCVSLSLFCERKVIFPNFTNLQNMNELETLLTPIIGKVLNQRESRQCDAGPPGPPGRDGRDGSTGLPGPPGSNGGNGLPGRDGVPGRDGLSGVQGPMGEKGAQGIQGVTGAMGVKGETGARGLPGSKFASSVFSAYKTTVDGNAAFFDGVVTYDTIIIGEDLIDKDTGIFTCKTGGTYSFVVSGHTQDDSYMGVYLNDTRELTLRNTGSGNYDNLSFTWTLTLNAGDRVQLKIEGGKFYIQATSWPYRLYFTGFLLA